LQLGFYKVVSLISTLYPTLYFFLTSHEDKIPETNNLKEGKIYLSLWFQSFSLWWVGSITFMSVARQNIMAESMGEDSCLLHGSQEAKKEKIRRHWGFNIPFKGRPPAT
jgi:hypothetical protein